jgi:hypothetical protein
MPFSPLPGRLRAALALRDRADPGLQPPGCDMGPLRGFVRVFVRPASSFPNPRVRTARTQGGESARLAMRWSRV